MNKKVILLAIAAVFIVAATSGCLTNTPEQNSSETGSTMQTQPEQENNPDSLQEETTETPAELEGRPNIKLIIDDCGSEYVLMINECLEPFDSEMEEYLTETRDSAICEEFGNSTLLRAWCLGNMAIINGNLEECWQISEELCEGSDVVDCEGSLKLARYNCVTKIAVNKKDERLCGSLLEENLMAFCKNEVQIEKMQAEKEGEQ